MKILGVDKNEWNIKFWCAKEFGWKPHEVDQMAWNDVYKLTQIAKKKNKKNGRS